MKYRLNEHLTLTTTEQGLNHLEASNALALIAGLTHDHVASQGPANVFVASDGSRAWIRKQVADGTEPDYSAFQNMPELNPFTNMAFCQSLIRSLGLVVSPILFENGNLVGQWRVELNTNYGANDMANSGLKVGVNEPVSEMSHSIMQAVCFAALRVAGIGRKAYLLRPEVEGERPSLQWMGDHTYAWMLANTDMGDDVVPVPELDEYAVTGISPEDAATKIEAALAALTEDSAPKPETPAVAENADANGVESALPNAANAE
ncbi:TPA: hypothetical protein ACGFAK_005047 [Serratia marcescens]|uniref:hypothetical protein n=1 Tax=Serratia TaxID=613 RepID=UPI0010226544|nr:MULTISPECIES: hypothetical protein [Serratia]MBP1133562.1 putative RNase H-like HicB family nuclease [Serratia sp. PL17]RYM67318.1 hypothetical protein BSQ99_24420 [Serratia liquefaciens]CAE7798081.1 hypothetical protein AI2795V1_4716 [Serratia marcescens]CAH3930504.1 hypothetical protein AI2795V1_4716 [Serratia marcescens]HBL7242003.1 hypothetical protein [Serratia liquefaciens]